MASSTLKRSIAALLVIIALLTTFPTAASAAVTGTVDVAAGNTLKVRSTPSTSGTVLSSLADGAVVSITCKTTGTTVTGTFGTTNQWDKIGAGYASHAYISTTGTIPNCTTTPPPPPATSKAQQAIDFGMSQINTRYLGCAGGEYRFGKVAPTNLSHDGRTCGQSRVYTQPAGSVGYDCSGLMFAMFKAAGINLPYTSSTSIKANVPQVSKSSITPGDMLAKNGHVAMYIGNNQVIESTPYARNGDGSWNGTRVTSATSYVNSSDYSAHRMPGL